MANVEWLAPIQRPGNVVCVGLNYRGHLAKIGEPVPKYPILFFKSATSIIGHGRPIVLPRISRQVDYEGELAVVIGRGGKYIVEENALTHVAGYTRANDAPGGDEHDEPGTFRRAVGGSRPGSGGSSNCGSARRAAHARLDLALFGARYRRGGPRATARPGRLRRAERGL